MGFQIKQPEKIQKSINRTLRFQIETFDQLEALAEKHNISFNFLVQQCIRYSLEHLEK